MLALDRMLTKGEGRIVHVGSMSAVDREPDSPVYVVTKAGIQASSESVRKLVSEMGFRVTLVEPGLVGADMTLEEHGVEDQRQEKRKGRMLKAEDIADCILYALTTPDRVDIVSLQVVPRLRML
jgi:NADP-dependent 3-hydroxy acid dehydrogenase YdfG